MSFQKKLYIEIGIMIKLLELLEGSKFRCLCSEINLESLVFLLEFLDELLTLIKSVSELVNLPLLRFALC